MPPPTPRWVLVLVVFACVAAPFVAAWLFGGGQ